MKAVIFVGPTISVEEASRIVDAEFHPPVSRGDVYRIGQSPPNAIGIIDGYFETVPAVWHKEILWALAKGIHVFGAASMGALRAAELAAFGMTGIGSVYEAYANGELMDDDEVTVSHAPAALNYRPLSEAMVNIRYTLMAAVDEGVIGGDTGERLVRLAKETFYKDRGYDNLLSRAKGTNIPPKEISALGAWLPNGKTDRKREDAIQLLKTISSGSELGFPPKEVEFKLQRTKAWAALAGAPPT